MLFLRVEFVKAVSDIKCGLSWEIFEYYRGYVSEKFVSNICGSYSWSKAVKLSTESNSSVVVRINRGETFNRPVSSLVAVRIRSAAFWLLILGAISDIIQPNFRNLYEILLIHCHNILLIHGHSILLIHGHIYWYTVRIEQNGYFLWMICSSSVCLRQ